MKTAAAILALAALALSGCQYVAAKKRVDAMKAASAARVEELHQQTTNTPAARVASVISSVAAPHAAIQQAQAGGVHWYYLGGALSGLAGLVLLALTYRAAGVTLLLGALALPLIVNVVSMQITVIVCAVILTAAIAFIAAWFIMRKFKYANPLSPDTPAIEARATTGT